MTWFEAELPDEAGLANTLVLTQPERRLGAPSFDWLDKNAAG